MAWRPPGQGNLFTPAVSSFKTSQDTDDPNSVVLVFEVTGMDKLGAIINDPANQKFSWVP